MRLWISLAILLTLSGCATYGDRQQAYQSQLTEQALGAAEATLTELVDPTGSERILYWLELGSLQHLQGQYGESNRSLQRADSLTRAWLELNNEERLKRFFATQDSAVYQPWISERWYSHYLQLKNYFILAQQGGGIAALDGMRVEARRLSMLLESNRRLESEQGMFDSLVSAAQPLQDPSIAAYYWWWVGVAYERLNEWDNARIAYYSAERNATGWLAEQALADKLRMHKQLGDSWQDEVTQLPEALQQQVIEWRATSWQTLTVDYKDWRPIVREVGFTIARLGDELIVSARGQEGSLLLTSLYGTASVSLPASEAFDVSVINFSVPYVPPVAMPAKQDHIVFSPAQAAHLDYQAQLPRLMINTAVRELSKAAAVEVIDSSTSTELQVVSILLSLYNAAVSTADTRYWMAMPRYVHVTRTINNPDVQLSAGQIRLYLTANQSIKE
ncbi:hypothetical protein [Salinibius halmophilus]|uniref:hypothetical protein n=1 Tax=Salinibius halmophilus TaxID=1853216 RepID=UPI000E6730AA|nr:hypothetical protein [Salinibius halmophilus]